MGSSTSQWSSSTAKRCRGPSSRKSSLIPVRAADIISQTADALSAAHGLGILHRDLKPDNIMIAKSRAGTDHVKIVDFGIARVMSKESQQLTSTGIAVGTPEYMSPEQFAGDALDARTDIYSLALVGYHVLTGAHAFGSGTTTDHLLARLTQPPRRLSLVKPDVAWPDALQAVFDKALSADPAQRYSDVLDFARDFTDAVAELPVTTTEEHYLSAIAVSPTHAAARLHAGAWRADGGRSDFRWRATDLATVHVTGTAGELVGRARPAVAVTTPSGEQPTRLGSRSDGRIGRSHRVRDRHADGRLRHRYRWAERMIAATPTVADADERRRKRRTAFRSSSAALLVVVVAAVLRSGRSRRRRPDDEPVAVRRSPLDSTRAEDRHRCAAPAPARRRPIPRPRLRQPLRLQRAWRSTRRSRACEVASSACCHPRGAARASSPTRRRARASSSRRRSLVPSGQHRRRADRRHDARSWSRRRDRPSAGVAVVAVALQPWSGYRVLSVGGDSAVKSGDSLARVRLRAHWRAVAAWRGEGRRRRQGAAGAHGHARGCRSADRVGGASVIALATQKGGQSTFAMASAIDAAVRAAKTRVARDGFARAECDGACRRGHRPRIRRTPFATRAARTRSISRRTVPVGRAIRVLAMTPPVSGLARLHDRSHEGVLGFAVPAQQVSVRADRSDPGVVRLPADDQRAASGRRAQRRARRRAGSSLQAVP